MAKKTRKKIGKKRAKASRGKSQRSRGRPSRPSRGTRAATPVTYPNVPASNVGNIVQTAIDFNGATDITAKETSTGVFTVTILG